MSYQDKAQASARYAGLRGLGLAGATGMAVADPNVTAGDVTSGYVQGAAAGIPAAVAAHVYGQRAAMEEAVRQKARARFMQQNPSMYNQPVDDLLRNGPRAAGSKMAPFVEPQRVGLRDALRESMKNPKAMAKGVLKGVPVVGSIIAGVEGAADGLKTPTEEYARRNSMTMPEGTAGQLGMRALGVMQDVGNAALLGLPKKHLWK